jgi:AcrR family transcriptional regulator
VFAERGFRTARMADVAKRAGIGKGTVYEYFRSKEDLFLAVFEAFTVGTLDTILARLDPQPESAVRRLREFADATLAACQEILYLYPLTLEFWSAAATPEFRDRLMGEFREFYARYRRVVGDAIRRGMADGEFGSEIDPDHLAAAFVGAIDALFLQAWFDPSFDPVAAGTHFLEVMLRGMAAGSATRAKTIRNER